MRRRRLLGCACCAAGGLFVPSLARSQSDTTSGSAGGPEGGNAARSAASVVRTAVTPAAVGAESAAVPSWRARLLHGARSLWLVRGDVAVRRTYWTPENGYDGDAYKEICWLLRDVQANKSFAMSPRLLDVLCGLQNWLAHSGARGPIHVNSAYRTFATNIRTEGSALNSRHLIGKAADIRVPGVTLARIAGMASLFGKGGVGMYVNKGFVHVDTGDERIWIK